MSDTVGSDRPAAAAAPDAAGDSTAAGRIPVPAAATPAVTGLAVTAPAAAAPDAADVEEAYSFACMNCGHCWEQAYEIRHHRDTTGRLYVTYRADGVVVPSPLTRPNCGNCDGHHVRIMRSGQVDGAVAHRWSLEHADRGVHRTRHWPALHFLRRRRRAHPDALNAPDTPDAAAPGDPAAPGGPTPTSASTAPGAPTAQAPHRAQER
ncbi:hypothetical protein [Actinacidiphila sp. DG2A-62]|uniref:hypothetical protein n=1 Tax=Actinacidiphila sp. DG2A-62 TaxID=3108821 RepID=UPI003FA3A0DA